MTNIPTRGRTAAAAVATHGMVVVESHPRDNPTNEVVITGVVLAAIVAVVGMKCRHHGIVIAVTKIRVLVLAVVGSSANVIETGNEIGIVTGIGIGIETPAETMVVVKTSRKLRLLPRRQRWLLNKLPRRRTGLPRTWIFRRVIPHLLRRL